MIYDFNDLNVAQPPIFLVVPSTSTPFYGSGIYGTSIYGSTVQPRITSNTQGSGKTIQIAFTSNDTNPPFSIQGISLQYRPLGRR